MLIMKKEMHVFSAFILPFHCIHIGVTKAHASCRRPKSFLRRCTCETILSSADAACRGAVSFLGMMHHCIIASVEPSAKKRCSVVLLKHNSTRKDDEWMENTSNSGHPLVAGYNHSYWTAHMLPRNRTHALHPWPTVGDCCS